MKRIIVVSLLSLIIFGVINTLIFENTWTGFRYRFIFGSLNGILPFVIATTLYHFILRALALRMPIFHTFLAQVCFGMLMSLFLLTLFVVIGTFFDGTSHKSIVEIIIRDAGFVLGAGMSITVVHYLVEFA